MTVERVLGSYFVKPTKINLNLQTVFFNLQTGLIELAWAHLYPDDSYLDFAYLKKTTKISLSFSLFLLHKRYSFSSFTYTHTHKTHYLSHSHSNTHTTYLSHSIYQCKQLLVSHTHTHTHTLSLTLPHTHFHSVWCGFVHLTALVN